MKKMVKKKDRTLVIIGTNANGEKFTIKCVDAIISYPCGRRLMAVPVDKTKKGK